MISEDLAAMRTHRNRIHYYRRLLEAQLTEPERQYVEMRLSEELCAFEDLKAAIFPLVFTISNPRTVQRCARAISLSYPVDNSGLTPDRPRQTAQTRKGHHEADP